MRTGLAYDPRFLEHDTGPGHPERAARLRTAHARLANTPWSDELVAVPPVEAEPHWIAAVHSLDYLRRAAAACAQGAPILDSPDVAISSRSFDCATLAAGAGIALAEAVIARDVDNGFALVRPPGHHAERAEALGFCLLNNGAILARYLQRAHGMDKIAILDWDVHHGNGTQHVFEEDPSVLYVSLHQYPYYPGTGSVDETGLGRGRGATLNCPMRAGAGDAAYERAFAEVVVPRLDAFRPEAVIISAGFDAHRDDPLADIALSTRCFGWMTERVMEVADSHAGGRVISLLEGGYHLERLADCVIEHLAVLSGQRRE